jgi:hypothetical protein
MKKLVVAALTALVILPLASSCTAVRSGVPVKAAFDSPAKAGVPVDERGWASRYIPGVRAISNLVPEPSEARVKWDEYYKKKNGHWSSSSVNNIP